MILDQAYYKCCPSLLSKIWFWSQLMIKAYVKRCILSIEPLYKTRAAKNTKHARNKKSCQQWDSNHVLSITMQTGYQLLIDTWYSHFYSKVYRVLLLPSVRYRIVSRRVLHYVNTLQSAHVYIGLTSKWSKCFMSTIQDNKHF